MLNFLIGNKIWLVIIAALLGVLTSFGVEIWKLKSDIEQAKTELKEANTQLVIKEANLQISVSNLNECNSKIDLQNERIKNMQIKPPDEQEVKERVITKFQKIKVPVKDTRCEQKLAYYESLFEELGR
ncbi:hypothetical protein [Campylobacter sp. FOBRC14]|uniref:hypothetical protein n=1 Tax=Campylobacter sp. FOBRC14 TaxID=936554 RepID=UPI00027A34B1|nr:hypothetical protein [Campylobacter sp. FOBRC14]EJP75630.1 hypothetical protein HMPREF1139_0771 [Campylobacter sp. FOBRC14]